MPMLDNAVFDIEGKNHGELEAMRRELISEIATKYKGYDDVEVPRELLHKLVVLTSTLRRKNAGPPKAAKAPKGTKAKATVDDLLI